MDDLLDIDVEGYLEGENGPDSITEVFDLHGKELNLVGSDE